MMKSFNQLAALAAMYASLASANLCMTSDLNPGAITTDRQCDVPELDDPTTGAFATNNTQFNVYKVENSDGYIL